MVIGGILYISRIIKTRRHRKAMNLNIFQYNQDKLTLQYAFNSWGLTQVRFKALAYQDLNSIISLLEGQSMFISFIQFSAAKVVSE